MPIDRCDGPGDRNSSRYDVLKYPNSEAIVAIVAARNAAIARNWQ